MKLDRKERRENGDYDDLGSDDEDNEEFEEGEGDADENGHGEVKTENNDEKEDNVTTEVYDNSATQSMYGGAVTVSVSYDNPYSKWGADFEEEDLLKKKKEKESSEGGGRDGKKGRDTAQWKAGNVGVFMEELKKNMPSKRDTKSKTGAKGWKGKGKHGSQQLIGGKSIKETRKILGRASKGKGGVMEETGKGKKGKKGKNVIMDGRGKGKKRKRPH